MKKKECGHGAPKGHCVQCDPRVSVVLRCKKCSKRSGGQTWHVVQGQTATCRRCGTERPLKYGKKDIGISNR